MILDLECQINFIPLNIGEGNRIENKECKPLTEIDFINAEIELLQQFQLNSKNDNDFELFGNMIEDLFVKKKLINNDE